MAYLYLCISNGLLGSLSLMSQYPLQIIFLWTGSWLFPSFISSKDLFQQHWFDGRICFLRETHQSISIISGCLNPQIRSPRIILRSWNIWNRWGYPQRKLCFSFVENSRTLDDFEELIAICQSMFLVGKNINNGILYTQTPEMQEVLKWPGTSEIKNNYLALPVSHCLLYPFY